MDLSLSGASAGSSQKMNSTLGVFESGSNNIKGGIPTFEGKTVLSCPEDKAALSPLCMHLLQLPKILLFAPPTLFLWLWDKSVSDVCIAMTCQHKRDRINQSAFHFLLENYQSIADI
jgi:hypothetical protein